MMVGVIIFCISGDEEVGAIFDESSFSSVIAIEEETMTVGVTEDGINFGVVGPCFGEDESSLSLFPSISIGSFDFNNSSFFCSAFFSIFCFLFLAFLCFK